MKKREETIALPPPSRLDGMSLGEAMRRRRSVRGFLRVPLFKQSLSDLLWAAQGTVSSGTRTAPSAGVTYPLEVFAVCGAGSIDGLGPGTYRYIPVSHSLTLHHEGDQKAELAAAALDQDCVAEAPLDIVICAVYERTAARYGARAQRYVHMEAGHAGQNIYLAATAMGLGTVAIGAFEDRPVREALHLDGRYAPLYIMPVGRPA